MKKKILFSLKSPYREQLDIIGFRFGHGKKALAIVGAMRGNEVQQMYVCSRMVQALKGHGNTCRSLRELLFHEYR